METLDAYLDRLASDAPAPGGGSASAVVAALAAALCAMIGRIVRRHPKNATFDAPLRAAIARAEALRTALEDARGRDERAFMQVIEAQALPKHDDDQRDARRVALQSALAGAAVAPLGVAERCVDVLRLAFELLDVPANALGSDAGCAAEFAYAALAGCAYNVRINHHFMTDATTVAAQEARLCEYEREGNALLERVRERLS